VVHVYIRLLHRRPAMTAMSTQLHSRKQVRSNRLALMRHMFWCVPSVLLLAACADDTPAPADSSATALGTAAAQWTSPVDKIPADTISAALAAVAKWSGPPGAALRHCRGTPACDRANNPAKVWVRVWAAKGAKDIGHRDVGPGNAVMIGKIQNHGQDTTEVYNLAPNTAYAVYLMQDAAGKGRYEIWRVQGNRKTMVAAGTQRECGHEDRIWDDSFAVFATCETSPTSQREVSRGDSVMMWANAGATTTHRDGPAWFTCTSGCCTADPD
jgi:hypothetical protein